ncbi:MAG: hypothetical protein RLZZ200_2624 [Pseudomonadota bacterium]|jgi:hypothetical protein
MKRAVLVIVVAALVALWLLGETTSRAFGYGVGR